MDAFSHSWEFPGVLYAFPPDSTANSGAREDSSNFAPGSFVSPHVAQAAVVQLPCGVVSSPRSPSPPRRVSPHNVQSSRLDIIRDGYRGQGFSDLAAGFLA